MKKGLLLIVAVLLMIFSGCGSNTEQSENIETTEQTTEISEEETSEESEYNQYLKGTWTAENGDVYNFDTDKTFDVDSVQGNITGTYSITNQGDAVFLALAITIDDVRVYDVKFSDNNKKITLTDENGKNIKLVFDGKE